MTLSWLCRLWQGHTVNHQSLCRLWQGHMVTHQFLCRLWQGHMVNHQFDKSFQWEQGFKNYLQRLQPGIQYSENTLMRLDIRLTVTISDRLHGAVAAHVCSRASTLCSTVALVLPVTALPATATALVLPSNVLAAIMTAASMRLATVLEMACRA